jgi:hypothetical protein
VHRRSVERKNGTVVLAVNGVSTACNPAHTHEDQTTAKLTNDHEGGFEQRFFVVSSFVRASCLSSIFVWAEVLSI